MDLDLVKIFVKVAQTGSFSKAAVILKLPVSSVSRAVAKLEDETATRLMVRTTRSLTLTAAGLDYFESCSPAILAIEEANKNLQGKDKTISGLVKITAPEDLGMSVIAPAIAELSLKYPKLTFDFNFTDAVVDIVREGFDVAIRLGKRKDSNLKLKQAGDVVLIAIASPKYLKGKNKISVPSDLKDHDCVSHFWSKQWKMKSTKSSAEFSIKTRITGNHMISMIRFAITGCGVAFVPKYLCEPYLKSGELVRVLPDWKSPPIPASIITPFSLSSSARVKVTVEAIHEALAKVLENVNKSTHP